VQVVSDFFDLFFDPLPHNLAIIDFHESRVQVLPIILDFLLQLLHDGLLVFETFVTLILNAVYLIRILFSVELQPATESRLVLAVEFVGALELANNRLETLTLLADDLGQDAADVVETHLESFSRLYHGDWDVVPLVCCDHLPLEF
jgi:hypothetical protein